MPGCDAYDASVKLHNKVVSYAKLKQVLPDRIQYVNPEERAAVDKIIENKELLHFLPTYLMETHMQDEKYQKAKYKIVLTGILRDGRRANVIIDGIEPYFEVKIKDGTKEDQKDQIQEILDVLEENESTTPTKKSVFMAKPFKGYQKNKSRFLRLYYAKIKNRQEAIKTIRKNNFETATDDLNSYYRVVCRDNLTTFSTWATLEEYTECVVENLKGETYRVDIKNYKKYRPPTTIDTKSKKEIEGKMPADMMKDKTLSMSWDLETYSPDGDIPKPENPHARITCIGMTFQWVHDKEPFLRIAACEFPSNAKPGYLTIVCGNEKNMISAFGEIFALMRPEFILDFNGSDYDWDWVIKRASQTKGMLCKLATCFDSMKPYQSYTDETVLKYNYKKEHVKVEATNYVDGYSLMMAGYIPVDVRTIFRRLYPTAEQSSLKWFLAKNKLGGKEDMPYEEMFTIVREYTTFMDSHCNAENNITNNIDLNISKWNNEDKNMYNELKDKMARVNSYCVVDAQRCHDLMKIRSVIMDHREVSDLSFVSVYDAFYRANGMKVRNLTIAVGQKEPFGIRFSNITVEKDEEGKYPGAFVIPPEKGLKVSKLSIKERVAKAKLTATMEQKACQEWTGTTDEEVEQFQSIVEKYGAVLDDEAIASVEKKLTEEAEKTVKLPKKFKDFLKESIGRPITGLDFSSLYPSLIRTYNLSPDYCIKGKTRKETKDMARAIAETGQKVIKVDFEFNKTPRLAYFVWHNNELDPKYEDPVHFEKPTNDKFQFGVYPYILNGLFNNRAGLKKVMKVFTHRKEEIEAMSKEEQGRLATEYDDVVFNYTYQNCKQNALKVFMNTFYGEAGNQLSPFFLLEVAGGITDYGQKNLKFAFKQCVDKHCKVYYGDSVAEYTPVLIRKNNSVCYCEIKDIAEDSDYSQYNNGKEIAFLNNVEVWSDVGWTKIKHVIRHKTNKKMYRVLTHNSVVDVTKDHSLLDIDGNILKPEDCMDKQLLTQELPTGIGNLNLVSADLAWVLGLFVAEGSCGSYACPSGNKSSWAIVNQDLTLLERAKTTLELEYPDYSWKILDCMESSAIHKLVPSSNGERGKIVEIVTEWRELCYYGQSKIIPDKILASPYEVQEEFLKGYYMGDGDLSSNNNTTNTSFDELSKRFDIKSQVSAFTFYVLCKNLDFNVSINCRKDKLDIYRLTITKRNQRKMGDKVKMILELPETTAYVYDFETENHHFSAGVGNLVLHNTDSLYLSTPEKDFDKVDKDFYSGKLSKLEYWTRMVEITFAAINDIRDTVNKAFKADNGTEFLSMAYEEILYPVAFTAKKKYFGIAHENIPNFKPKDLFIRGLEVKKRGVSDLLKKIFMEIMWLACSTENLYNLHELVIIKINEIYSRKWVPSDFVQTGVYRPPKGGKPGNVKINTFVRRMKEKGLEVKPNERFNYVIVKKYPYSYDTRGRKTNISIGDKLEFDYVAERDHMEVDLDYYMQGSVNGQLARLVTYHDMFHIDPLDNSKDEQDTAEKKIYNNACKYVDEYCKRFYSNYNTFGKAYQKIFKTANKAVSSALHEVDPLAGDLLCANVDYDDFEDWFVEYTAKKADKITADYGSQLIMKELDYVSQVVKAKHAEQKEAEEDNAIDVEEDTKEAKKAKRASIAKEIKARRTEKLKDLQKCYYGNGRKSIIDIKETSFKETMSILRKRIRENFEEIMKLYSVCNKNMESMTNLIKERIDIKELSCPSKSNINYTLEDFDFEMTDDLEEQLTEKALSNTKLITENAKLKTALSKLKTLYNDLLAAHISIKRARNIVDYLKQRRDKENKTVIRPNNDVIKKLLTTSSERDVAEIDVLNI